MIGHNHKLWNFRIGIMLSDFFDTLLGMFPNIRQNHFSIHNFTEKMFPMFCADSDEIGTVIVIVPPGTGGFYPIFILKFVV
mgnify:CR=1 FL=1